MCTVTDRSTLSTCTQELGISYNLNINTMIALLIHMFYPDDDNSTIHIFSVTISIIFLVIQFGNCRQCIYRRKRLHTNFVTVFSEVIAKFPELDLKRPIYISFLH